MSRLGVHLGVPRKGSEISAGELSWIVHVQLAQRQRCLDTELWLSLITNCYHNPYHAITMTVASAIVIIQVSISSQLSLHYHWNYHYFHCYLYHFVSLSLQPSYCILSSQLYSRLLLSSQLPLASYLSPSITIITPFNYRHNNYHYHYHNHYHWNHNIHYSYQYHRHELSSFP